MISRPSQGFSKRNKIHKTSDFQRIFANGNEIRLDYINVLSFENSLNYPRLGMTITKKRLPRAVDRNKFKRIIREIFRKNKDRIDSKDILVVSRINSNNRIKNYKGQEFERYLLKVHSYS